jgi:hypothetical protein
MLSTAKRGLRQKVRKSTKRKPAQRKMQRARAYDTLKEFGGKKYTGMAIGRGHVWKYDQGEWKESKITPDLWEFSFAVTKRRAYQAPEGSGAAIGSGYHWMILAHQNVFKTNANEYTTAMSGLKFKIAHKRASTGTWSASAKAQRKHLISFLEDNLKQLKVEPIPLEFEYNGITYKGEAIPIQTGCHDGICDQHDVSLNNEHIGLIRCTKSGWRLSGLKDIGLIEAIGHELFLWYE